LSDDTALAQKMQDVEKEPVSTLSTAYNL